MIDSEGLLAAYTYTLGRFPSSTSLQENPEFPATPSTRSLHTIQYNQLLEWDEFQAVYNGSKSFANRFDNQQFKGTSMVHHDPTCAVLGCMLALLELICKCTSRMNEDAMCPLDMDVSTSFEEENQVKSLFWRPH